MQERGSGLQKIKISWLLVKCCKMRVQSIRAFLQKFCEILLHAREHFVGAHSACMFARFPFNFEGKILFPRIHLFCISCVKMHPPWTRGDSQCFALSLAQRRFITLFRQVCLSYLFKLNLYILFGGYLSGRGWWVQSFSSAIWDGFLVRKLSPGSISCLDKRLHSCSWVQSRWFQMCKI